MKRSPINRNFDRIRAWHDRTRRPLPARSAKRKAKQGERSLVREQVAQRAGWRCEYRHIIPEVSCGFLPRRGMEVDELRGGLWRRVESLDPDACRYTCPVHHDWKTDHKVEVLRRLGVPGYA